MEAIKGVIDSKSQAKIKLLQWIHGPNSESVIVGLGIVLPINPTLFLIEWASMNDLLQAT